MSFCNDALALPLLVLLISKGLTQGMTGGMGAVLCWNLVRKSCGLAFL